MKIYDLSKVLTFEGLNSLTFEDPYLKNRFICILLSHYPKITYIDLDTTFTAYTRSEIIKMDAINKIINIFLLEDKKFHKQINEIIDSISTSSIVIIDSINSFYNLYYKKIDFNFLDNIGEIQHILSNFIMLLLKYCISLKIPLLVTSMIRYKKEKIWIQSPANTRLIQKKSVTKLHVRENRKSKHIVLDIAEHLKLDLEKIVITYNNLNQYSIINNNCD